MKLADIKKEFFTYRNGIVADNLRKAGDPHNMIFGLLLPQISQIATAIGKDKQLACELWQNNTCRESQLLAPMLYPIDDFSEECAFDWVEASSCAEVTDILCMKLLRNLSYAETLAYDLICVKQKKYAGYRLYLNLIAIGKLTDFNRLKSLIEQEPVDDDIAPIISQIKEDL